MDSCRHEAAPFSPLTWSAAAAAPAVGTLPQPGAAAAPHHRPRPVLPHAPPEESKKKKRRRETREGLARAQLEFVANREKIYWELRARLEAELAALQSGTSDELDERLLDDQEQQDQHIARMELRFEHQYACADAEKLARDQEIQAEFEHEVIAIKKQKLANINVKRKAVNDRLDEDLKALREECMRNNKNLLDEVAPLTNGRQKRAKNCKPPSGATYREVQEDFIELFGDSQSVLVACKRWRR